jgi:hypothetical protein
MAKAGGDLWSHTAVAVLKRSLRDAVATKWGEALESKAEAQAGVNGPANDEEPTEAQETADAEPIEGQETADSEPSEGQDTVDPGTTAEIDDAEEKNDDILIQALFDILLLQSAFRLADVGADGLVKLGGSIEEKIGIHAAAKKRIIGAAKEYWKRTALLFGLLA